MPAPRAAAHPAELELIRLAHRLRLAAASRSGRAMSSACDDAARMLESLAICAPVKLRDPGEIEAIRKWLAVRNKGSILLLLELLEAPGNILRHRDLLHALDSTRGALKVYVCELRKALETRGAGDPIQTIWGVGYCVPAVDAVRIRKLMEDAGIKFRS